MPEPIDEAKDEDEADKRMDKVMNPKGTSGCPLMTQDEKKVEHEEKKTDEVDEYRTGR